MRSAVLFVTSVLVVTSPARADTEWNWFQGDKPRKMESSATSMCVLTRVAGRFSGGGEFVRVVDDGKNWVLDGQSQQSGVSAFARCVPLSNFKAKGSARWHRDFNQNWQGTSPGSCIQNPADAWWGDAATFISRVGGQYRGAGEYIEVKPSANGKTATQWISQTCRDGGEMAVSVTSFFVGTPHAGGLVRMIGPNGTGSPAQAGEWRIGPKQHVQMASEQDAICGLTYVSGEFLSAGEAVHIYGAYDHWMLGTTSQSGTGTLAGARCMAYQQ